MPWTSQSSVYSLSKREFLDLHQETPYLLHASAKGCSLSYVFEEGFKEGGRVKFSLFHGSNKLTWTGTLANVDVEKGYEIVSESEIFKQFKTYHVFSDFENQLLVRENIEFEAVHQGMNIALEQISIMHSLESRKSEFLNSQTTSEVIKPVQSSKKTESFEAIQGKSTG